MRCAWAQAIPGESVLEGRLTVLFGVVARIAPSSRVPTRLRTDSRLEDPYCVWLCDGPMVVLFVEGRCRWW